MSSARLDRLLASTSARLAAVYAGLLLIAFLIAGLGAWFATKSAAEHQIRERIQLEMSALQEEIRVEGAPAAIAAIRTRAESPGALEYRLTASNGAQMIGGLKVDHPPLGWSFLDLPDSDAVEEGGEDFIILTAPTPDGGLLTIGDDLAQAERVRAAVLSALFWVGGVALLLALAAGIVASRGALARMDALSNTLALVGAGDLSARASERAGGDDIDRIGRGVNQMLARIDVLVANTRRVSSDIAHDLRTPLTHVRQQLDTAAATSDSAVVQEAIRAAQVKIDSVLRIFAAMLRLAEIEAGGARSRFARVALAALTERVADAYRPDIEAAGHPFTVDTIEGVTVEGDADLLAQAVGNLLENALRHTPAGTPITLRWRHSGEGASLELEDKGDGIDASDRARVLEPFVRLDNSRTAPGAGLGLSIVGAIARLHGANLVLEDAMPGLRISLVWPRHGLGNVNDGDTSRQA